MGALGVTKLSDKGFLEDLKAAFEDNSHEIHLKSDEWHSSLAKALSSLIAKERQHQNAVSALKVIPLNDGNWVSAKSGRIFFSSGSNSASRVLDGIPISVVDPKAEADYHRHNLFTHLGVRPYESSEICRLILDTHGSSRFKPKELERMHLVSHVKFLFAESWPPPEKAKFWFVAEDGTNLQGSELYIDADPTSSLSASSFFKDARHNYPFLHLDYLAAVDEEKKQDWITYLKKHFNLSTHPRLVHPLLGSNFDLSEGFGFIFKNSPASMALRLLRDHWGNYAKWIMREGYEGNQLDNSAKDRLRSALSKTQVKCLNGQDYPLNTTFILSADASLEDFGRLSTMPILDIEDPKNEGWKFLEFLGVSVKKHVRLYLFCLEGMEQENMIVPRSVLSYIYEQIQSMYGDDEMFVR